MQSYLVERASRGDEDAFAALAAFSADGTKLVFARDRGDNALGSLDIVGVDGNGLHEIVPESIEAAGPHWSPDGSKILFGNLDTASAAIGHNIHVVNVDGSGMTSLTDETSPSGDGGPTRSSSGTRSRARTTSRAARYGGRHPETGTGA